MKITIYSYRTAKDLKILKESVASLGTDLMFDKEEGYSYHPNEAVSVFLNWVTVKRTKFLCNNGDVVNHVIGWCEDNSVECEVVTCSQGEVITSPVVDGFLTNWSYGWYLPDTFE